MIRLHSPRETLMRRVVVALVVAIALTTATSCTRRTRIVTLLRTYSIAAVSDASTTRAVLMNGWRTLSVFSLEQDSQMIHEDAIIPGSAYLGMALGDHWSVALPFERIPGTIGNPGAVKLLKANADYPRVALFEAVIRYAMAEIPPTAAVKHVRD